MEQPQSFWTDDEEVRRWWHDGGYIEIVYKDGSGLTLKPKGQGWVPVESHYHSLAE